jgi:hypothetical protein
LWWEALPLFLNGAPINTFDLDIVHARDSANAARLADVLGTLHAIYRMQPDRRIKPDISHLASRGLHDLMTNCGPLDVSGSIGLDLEFDNLLKHTLEMDVGVGLRVRVLDLPTIIALKEQLAGEKDRAVLPVLRQTLEQKRLKEG